MSIDPRLSHFVRSYDGALSSRCCSELIEYFEKATAAQTPNGRGHHAGLDNSAWTELNLTRHGPAAMLTELRRGIDGALARYNRDTGLSMPVPPSPMLADFILKRYRPGGAERFELHFDSIYSVSNRYLVMLWYLNTVPEGGETVFPDLELAVSPAIGRLLVFPPYWLYQHAGEPPVGGDKFILSTYLLWPSSPS